MRKIIILLSALFLILGFSCSKDPQAEKLHEWVKPNGKIKVLSTTAMINDLAKEVGGDRVDCLVLIQGDQDPHSYELVKGDDEKLNSAHLIFFNGLGLEHGASLDYRLKHHSHAISLGNWIQQRFPEKILAENQENDPHIWMDVSLWAEALNPIVDALTQQEEKSATYFKANADAFLKKMQLTDQKMRTLLQAIPTHKRYLVTTHDALNYFTRRYLAEEAEKNWKSRFAAPEGLAPDGELSIADIGRIVQFLCIRHVSVIFPESNVSRTSLQKILEVCLAKGLKISLSQKPLYTDAMGPPGSCADTYLKMMEYNAEIISDSLKGSP
jgi:manganese/zinc/iron transport system substrate-binding protein